jgi:hypothetical protein
MRARGRRPRTRKEVEELRTEYIRKYGREGYPAGIQDPQQHRDWAKLHNAVRRLKRREAGLCYRCNSSIEAGIYCARHRAMNCARSMRHGALFFKRKLLRERQGGECPICMLPIDLWGDIDHDHRTGKMRGLLHPKCNRAIGAIEKLGPDAIERVRDYLSDASR